MIELNLRIVDDFKINIEFYCDNLGFKYQERENDKKENVLVLKYEENIIEFILRSTIKDIGKEFKNYGYNVIQIEVQNLGLEKDKVDKNNIQVLDWIHDKEFSFIDCNGFEIRFYQYEIANLHKDL